MKAWPPFQLLILAVLLGLSGFLLSNLIARDPTLEPAAAAQAAPSPAGDERVLFVDLETTAELLSLQFTIEGREPTVVEAPVPAFLELTFPAGEPVLLRIEVEFAETARLPAAVRVALEPEGWESREVVLWAGRSTRAATGIVLAP